MYKVVMKHVLKCGKIIVETNDLSNRFFLVKTDPPNLVRLQPKFTFEGVNTNEDFTIITPSGKIFGSSINWLTTSYMNNNFPTTWW